MLIVDSPSVFTDRAAFNARGAAILGFSIFARKKYYALTNDLTLNKEALQAFSSRTGPILIFGFTFMIWKYLCQAIAETGLSFDFSNAVVIHGGGWKKMEAQAVSAEAYKRRLYDQFRISRVHNYYGMAEQTGCRRHRQRPRGFLSLSHRKIRNPSGSFSYGRLLSRPFAFDGGHGRHLRR